VQRAWIVTSVQEDEEPTVTAAAWHDADLRQPAVQQPTAQVVVDDLRATCVRVTARLQPRMSECDPRSERGDDPDCEDDPADGRTLVARPDDGTTCNVAPGARNFSHDH
jgi:hypothetical protein